MSGLPKELTVGYGLLNADTGEFLAADITLKDWLNGRLLGRLLPDFDLAIVSRSESSVEQTRICPHGGEAALALIELTRVRGDSHSWCVLRIQIAPTTTVTEYRDAVTNLFDRRALEQHRLQWLQEATGDYVPHALLFMDLDHFKEVNDKFGHATGDKVLAVLAERWRKALRGRDLVVRYGGDEFVVLLAGVRSTSDAQPIVDRLTRSTAKPIEMDQHSIQVSVAIGVALADGAETSLGELLAKADQAMYAVKRRAQ
jgi:diguanylate cyclase (GGDEF)-like protein